MTVQYAEMVGFLKGMRLAGKDVRCRLSSTYDVIRKEYERHLALIENTSDESVIDSIDIDSLPPSTNACQSPQFTKINVLECVDETHIIIEIENEARIVEIRWNDIISIATTVRHEVAVISDGTEQNVNICQLDIYNKDGQFYAHPLCKHGGKVEWLYPDEKTRYYCIKANIRPGSNNWKSICVDTNNQSLGIVTARDFAACRCVYDDVLKITKRFPFKPQFIRVNGTWVMHEASSKIDWIYGVQGAIQHHYKIGGTVYLQDEYGQPKISLWQICSTSYIDLCLMASIRCISSSNRHKRNDTTILPVMQLIPAKNAQVEALSQLQTYPFSKES